MYPKTDDIPKKQKKMKSKDLDPVLVAGCSKAHKSLIMMQTKNNSQGTFQIHLLYPKVVSNNSYSNVCSSVYSSDWYGFN